jgi:hypothetical protein
MKGATANADVTADTKSIVYTVALLEERYLSDTEAMMSNYRPKTLVTMIYANKIPPQL